MYLFQPSTVLLRSRAHCHLHSTMYLFQPVLAIQTAVIPADLHSTMYLFQHATGIIILPENIDLHSTMYLFQLGTYRDVAVEWHLFTFHYVSISTQIFRSLISIRIIVALLSTKQTSIIFILTCSGNIWIITDKIRIVDLPVILQYYVPTVKA